ncbi:MAG: C10 family peptidase [Bacteroidota bacterium]|nr:C10 family peptidase [Bacteroidota bacterium]
MRRQRYILTILTLFMFVVSVFGKPVTLTEVREAVNALLQSWGKQMDIEAIDARYLHDGELGYYMVDLKQGGWVMVSADDVMRPVMAFSFENSLAPEAEWNDAARYLLNLYKQEISLTLEDASLPRDARWDREAQASAKKAAAADPVDPFIPVNWNQSSGWNMFCPEDEEGPGGHTYVGCVAVAMAQAMSVYEYPVRPEGVKDYVHPDYGSIAVNYDMADPYEWGLMSATSADEYNAILLYHCAVAVEMDFGADGSGAWVRDANAAMKRYFNYSQSMTFEERYTDTEEWVTALSDELEAGRPIIYRGNQGDGTAGHAWNVDGYRPVNTTDFFHMNFGWSGSQNGYYTLDEINPGTNDFNANQGAILGIALPSSAPYDLDLSEQSVPEELPDSSFVADVLVSDEDPDNVYTFTCKGPFSVILDDYGPASFYIEDQKLYTKEVFEYDDADPESNSVFLLIIVEDQYGTEYQEEFDIAIEKVFHGPTGIALSDSSVLEEKPVGTAVAKVVVEDEDTSNTYTYTIDGSFYIENDTLKTSVEFDYETADNSYVLITVEDSRGFVLSRGFTIEILENQSGTTGIKEQSRDVSIYPNPADQYIYLKGLEGYQSIEMWELSGKMLMKISTGQNQLDVSGLKNGIYLLVCDGSDGRLVRKLLIQH